MKEKSQSHNMKLLPDPKTRDGGNPPIRDKLYRFSHQVRSKCTSWYNTSLWWGFSSPRSSTPSRTDHGRSDIRN